MQVRGLKFLEDCQLPKRTVHCFQKPVTQSAISCLDCRFHVFARCRRINKARWCRSTSCGLDTAEPQRVIAEPPVPVSRTLMLLEAEKAPVRRVEQEPHQVRKACLLAEETTKRWYQSYSNAGHTSLIGVCPPKRMRERPQILLATRGWKCNSQAHAQFCAGLSLKTLSIGHRKQLQIRLTTPSRCRGWEIADVVARWAQHPSLPAQLS